MVLWLNRGPGPGRATNATHATERTNGLRPSVTYAKLELTEAQAKAAQAFIAAAAAVSESLAADNLEEFNRAAPQTTPALQALLDTLTADHVLASVATEDYRHRQARSRR